MNGRHAAMVAVGAGGGTDAYDAPGDERSGVDGRPVDKGGLRFWDGAKWTLQVARRRTPPKPPHQRLPLAVALGAITTILSSLVLSRFLLRALARNEWPIAVYVVIAGTLGYGPVQVFGWWASRRWGSGSLRDDGGLHFRVVDAGWGPVTWLAALGAQLAVGMIVVVTKIPLTSNTEGIDRLAADRGYVISLLVVSVPCSVLPSTSCGAWARPSSPTRS
jgi:hypothetical protein